jgi:glutamate racemase
MDNRPIGVMDSGLGGLSVVRVIQQELPNEEVIFVGDQGHFPYGTKDPAEVRGLALSIGSFLQRNDVKMMIIACNTATAAALPALQDKLPVPVIGVIEPGARAALVQDKKGAIGVIATTATINSGAYPAAIENLAPGTPVITQATQPMVKVVERGQTGTSTAQEVVDEQLAPFKDQPIKTLIMGCTHFPFLAPEISRTLGKTVTLVDPAKETVATAKKWLEDHQSLGNHVHPQYYLYSTGNLADLQAGVNKWLLSGKFRLETAEIKEGD